MGAEQFGVQPDAREPFRKKSRILAGRDAPSRTTVAGEEELTRPLSRNLQKSSIASRVWSVNSNLTGRPVFFCRTVARSMAYPLGATSSTLRERHNIRAACYRQPG